MLKSSVQLLSHVWLFATPWTAAHQASLSITNCQSLPKPMSIESVMPSNHLILCCPLLLLPSVFPSIRVFSNESALWEPLICSINLCINKSDSYLIVEIMLLLVHWEMIKKYYFSFHYTYIMQCIFSCFGCKCWIFS